MEFGRKEVGRQEERFKEEIKGAKHTPPLGSARRALGQEEVPAGGGRPRGASPQPPLSLHLVSPAHRRNFMTIQTHFTTT